MPDALPEPLLDYFAQREAARAQAVTDFLASLTERERRLMREAAVMGYVRGRMHPDSESHPKGSAVFTEVVDACIAIPDLYPAVHAVAEPGERTFRQTVEYFVQCQQPDGTWEQASSMSVDPDFVVERLAARRRMHPDFVCRIARRTTAVLVEPQLTEPAP